MYFSKKAIKIWLSTNEVQHCQIVSWYYHFAGFENIKAKDISDESGRDPMHVVQATNASRGPRTMRGRLGAYKGAPKL